MMFAPLLVGLAKGAAVGGAMGAGTAAITGGDVGRGALLGAAGGAAFGGLGAVGSGATSSTGQMALSAAGKPSAFGNLASSAHSFNQGLSSAFGLGGGGFGKAGSLGSQFGEAAIGQAGQGLLSAAMSNPQAPVPMSQVTDVGTPTGRPSPVAQLGADRDQQAANGSLIDSYLGGLA